MKSCKVFVCAAILAAFTARVAVPTEFTVHAALVPAALVSVTPNRGQQGQTIAVTIIAQDTQFIPGVTEAKFGDGILVGGGGDGDFGPVTVTSPTSATAQITIEDPKALTKPWVVTRRYTRMPKGTRVYDYACGENNRNPVDETGRTLTLGPDGRALDKK